MASEFSLRLPNEPINFFFPDKPFVEFSNKFQGRGFTQLIVEVFCLEAVPLDDFLFDTLNVLVHHFKFSNNTTLIRSRFITKLLMLLLLCWCSEGGISLISSFIAFS